MSEHGEPFDRFTDAEESAATAGVITGMVTAGTIWAQIAHHNTPPPSAYEDIALFGGSVLLEAGALIVISSTIRYALHKRRERKALVADEAAAREIEDLRKILQLNPPTQT